MQSDVPSEARVCDQGSAMEVQSGHTSHHNPALCGRVQVKWMIFRGATAAGRSSKDLIKDDVRAQFKPLCIELAALARKSGKDPKSISISDVSVRVGAEAAPPPPLLSRSPSLPLTPISSPSQLWPSPSLFLFGLLLSPATHR